MKTTYLTFSVVILAFTMVKCSINEIEDYRLAERELGYRNRFVFSDWKTFNPTFDKLANASVDVDLEFKPVNMQESGSVCLFVMVAESTLAVEIAMQMEQEKTSGKLSNASDILNIMNKYAALLPIYGNLVIDPNSKNQTYKYQKSNNVYDQGAHYLILIYARE